MPVPTLLAFNFEEVRCAYLAAATLISFSCDLLDFSRTSSPFLCISSHSRLFAHWSSACFSSPPPSSPSLVCSSLDGCRAGGLQRFALLRLGHGWTRPLASILQVRRRRRRRLGGRKRTRLMEKFRGEEQEQEQGQEDRGFDILCRPTVDPMDVDAIIFGEGGRGGSRKTDEIAVLDAFRFKRNQEYREIVSRDAGASSKDERLLADKARAVEILGRRLADSR
eukprot:344807-Hanusia_phi.AAC.13